jgi:hypothetical protein
VLDSERRLYDVWAGENQRVYVSAGDGWVYRYDDSAGDWTPIGVTDGVALRSIDVEIYDDVGEVVVIGGDGSLYQWLGDEHWIRLPSPTSSSLLGLSVGGDLDVAEFAAATEYDAAAIEETLVHIATASGADTEAFRDALYSGS